MWDNVVAQVPASLGEITHPDGRAKAETPSRSRRKRDWGLGMSYRGNGEQGQQGLGLIKTKSDKVELLKRSVTSKYKKINSINPYSISPERYNLKIPKKKKIILVNLGPTHSSISLHVYRMYEKIS